MADKKGAKKFEEIRPEDKGKALEAALAYIEKQFGKGAVMKLGDSSAKMSVEVIPTGSLSLDIALGVGGIPKGRIIEVYGPESSGKTTIALHMVAEVQKQGGIAGYIDAEHAMDPVYAKALGVDIDNLYISQPDDGEQALEIAETMVRSGAMDIVIVDSVAALVPRAEIQGEMGDSHMGLQARLMSQALRKLTGITNKSKCSVIFINALKQGDAVVGNRTKVKIAKNKVAPPFKTAEFDIMYGQGVSKEGDILDLAVEIDVVNKSGAWYSYKETRIGQGRENAKIYLKEHPEECQEIEKEVRKYYNLPINEEEMMAESKEKENMPPELDEEDDMTE